MSFLNNYYKVEDQNMWGMSLFLQASPDTWLNGYIKLTFVENAIPDPSNPDRNLVASGFGDVGKT